LEPIPKPLTKQLVLTLLVGAGCLFTGITFYFIEKDSVFLSLSLLVFFCSVDKSVFLFFNSGINPIPLSKEPEVVSRHLLTYLFQILLRRPVSETKAVGKNFFNR